MKGLKEEYDAQGRRRCRAQSFSEKLKAEGPWRTQGFSARLKTNGPWRADDGLILGVAKGLADYFGWSVTLVRVLLVLVSVFVFFWPTIIAYIVAAIIMGPAPKEKLDSEEQKEIWPHTQLDPQGGIDRLARRAAEAERRLRRLEDYVTSRDFQWRKKFSGS